MNQTGFAPAAGGGKRPVAIDLFAGCGGLSLGFEQAGFDIAAAVEIDPVTCAVHECNFPRTMPICADAQNISGREIRERAGLWAREIDVVMGGPPCQDFSQLGKRAIDDPQNRRIAHFVRLIGELRPKYCVLENVKGLTPDRNVTFLTDAIDELGRLGYDVLLPYRALDAADYGIPQDCRRLFLIAARRGLPPPEYPPPAGERTTVADAIDDLPDPDHFTTLRHGDAVTAFWETESPYALKLRGILDDPGDFGYRRIFRKNFLTSSNTTEHSKETRIRFFDTEPGRIEPRSGCFRLAWDGRSNALQAGPGRGARGDPAFPRPIHPHFERVITVREAARLHSYPDWFRFNKDKRQGFREIGDSVPPLLARAVGAAVIRALGVSPSRPAESVRPGPVGLLEFDGDAAAAHFAAPRSLTARPTRKNAHPREEGPWLPNLQEQI